MLLGGLIPQSDFSQLVRLGELRTHYLEHKAEALAENKKLSFLDFLYIHYINLNQHADNDHEEDHHQLPLQNINNTINFFVNNTVPLSDFKETTTSFSPPIAYQSPFYLGGFLSALVQPPS